MKVSEIKAKAFLSASSYITKRLIGCKFKRLDQAAYKSEVIVEAGMIDAITPFYWESHLPRIMGAKSYGAEQVINEDLNRKHFHFKAVIGYWLRDAVLLDGSVYCGLHRHDLRNIHQEKRRISLNMSGSIGHMKEAALVSTVAGSTWWGHFLEDEIPLQMLSEKFAQPVAHNRHLYRDEICYREILKVESPIRYSVAYFDNLLIIDEFAQNPNKTRRYKTIRDNLKYNVKSGFDRIYLRRGETGARRVLINEDKIIALLEIEGYKVVDISSSSADEIMSFCMGASVVVSVEGSHLAPLLYSMRDFASLIILNPPNQVHTTVADIGVFCGLSSAMFICETTDTGDPSTEFYADPDELCRFIDDAIVYGSHNAARLEGFLDKVLKMDKTGFFQ